MLIRFQKAYSNTYIHLHKNPVPSNKFRALFITYYYNIIFIKSQQCRDLNYRNVMHYALSLILLNSC
jgi:hypothetical protein